MAPTTVSRAEWGARAPRSVVFVPWSDRTGVAIHHSAGPTSQTVRQIQDFHMDTNGWSDIGYNWLVDQAGLLYVGRGWTARGTHSAGENISHIAVCWIGNSSTVEPSRAASAAIRWVYDEACRLTGRTLSYSGHGQLPGEATQCPGDRLRAWIADGMPLPTGGDDMEQTERLINDTGSPTRTVGNVLSDVENIRNWLISAPGAVTLGAPAEGSVGAIILAAAQRPPVEPPSPAPVDVPALVAELVPALLPDLGPALVEAITPVVRAQAEAAVREVLGEVDEQPTG